MDHELCYLVKRQTEDKPDLENNQQVSDQISPLVYFIKS